MSLLTIVMLINFSNLLALFIYIIYELLGVYYDTPDDVNKRDFYIVEDKHNGNL